jgi:hypothetical protein
MRALNIVVISVLLSAWSSLSLAQVTPPPATAPTAPAPAAWYDAYGWWWIILAIIIVGGVIWWFTRSRGTRL